MRRNETRVTAAAVSARQAQTVIAALGLTATMIGCALIQIALCFIH